MRPEVVVDDDPAALAVERLATAAVPGSNLVLTGGSTPRTTYERLAGKGLDWAGVGLWFTDERCVPPDDEQSNYAMVEKALLGRIEGADVHRIQGELGQEEGAAAYEEELRRSFGEEVPAFDLVLLGVGPDAHVCSLFPNQRALGERERLAVGVEKPGLEPMVPRVTLTLPVVNAAREVVFLVSGEDKAEALGRAFSGTPDPGAPASLVQPASGSMLLFADPPAAARLAGR